jgi:hypothetical protein
MLVTAYVNGSTAGNPPPPRDHSDDKPRGEVVGWTPGAVRRHTRWLYSVESDRLGEEDVCGFAITLTLRDTPATAADWSDLLRRWVDRVRKDPAFELVRMHWVVEWQRRGAPHIHAAIYFRGDPVDTYAWGMSKSILHWVKLAGAYGAQWQAQEGKPIDGALGWLQYLSKHAARGVRHYQRFGHPSGWERTGRLWGHRGPWPVAEPMKFDMGPHAYWRYRRLIRSWRVAQARQEGNPRRIAAARRMLACTDLRLSPVRGVSEWTAEPVALTLIGMLHDEGHLIRQREES